MNVRSFVHTPPLYPPYVRERTTGVGVLSVRGRENQQSAAESDQQAHTHNRDIVIRLRPMGDQAATFIALRRLLKRLGRHDRLKCVEVREVEPDAEPIKQETH